MPSHDSSFLSRPVEPDSPPDLGRQEWLAQSRERLRKTVSLRIDPRLAGRVDPSDVVQEALLEATQRWEEYQEKSNLPPFLWLRLMTLQRLALIHRQNLGVKARDVRREMVRTVNHDYPEASSVALAELLVGRCSTPSQAASRAELRQRVGEALANMELIDREVLTLRHFEQLTNREAAEVLDLTEAAASKRYLRALRRIKEILAANGLDSET